MRKTILFLLILLIPVLICANAILGTSLQRPRYAANILKIQLSTEAIASTNLPTEYYSEAPEFGIEELDELAASYGSHKILRAHIRMKDTAFEQRTGFDRWFLLIYDQALDVTGALDEFKLQKRWIQEAIPEYYAYTTAVPNDTYYANNWGHNNTAQLPVYTGGSHSGAGVGTIGFDSDAQLAWDQSQGYGLASIIIAIIDTGVDTAHPDLRLTSGYDYGDNDSNPMDDSADPGHGTACSGVAAGRANNALGVTGIAGGCTVMPLKIADSAGNLGFTAIENALTHTGNNGVHVASMSFGAEGGMGEGDSPSTDTALEYAYSHGVTLLAATANSNASAIAYPSNHNKVISVGAASPTGQRKSTSSSDGENWWGSNYGVDTMNDREAVDIMAPTILPATDITGTGNGYNTTSDYYMWFNGTSCATPYAAGVAALIKSKDPSLTPAQVLTALTSTATDMTFDGGAGWDRYTGYGMVNANNALLSLVPGMPTCQISSPASGSVVDLNSTVTINVTATDSDGTISNVKFYVDNVLQNTDTTSPYSWNWNTVGYSGGSHVIKAVATDNSANTAQSEIIITLLAPPSEGFETGNFSAYPWVNTSSIPWTVQNVEKFSGTYAAKSGAITHSGTTDLSITLNVTENGNISFYQKVSSESGYDYLRFFIDGVQQAQWSGSGDWTLQSYPVTAGSHAFLWRYLKDTSVSSGGDCAWIDHITFPPTGSYYAPPQNFAALAGNGYVNLSWQAPASGTPTGYKIFRNDVLLTTVTGLSYTDNAVVNETTYSYYLKAVYSGGESAATATVNATPTAIVPTEFIIGTGTTSTGSTEGCPVNVYYRSLHGQSVYTAAELNAAGIFGPISINQLGFNITGLPDQVMPTFLVRMGHTSQANAASWVPESSLTTLWSATSYQPAATGWNMYTLSTPFLWNGTDNIVVDTAFEQVPTYTSTGTVQFTTVSTGYRYVRDDNNNQTSIFAGGSTTNSRPNVKLVVIPNATGPSITVNPTSLSYGDVAVGTSSTQQFTITNSGNETLTGSITTPNSYSVSLVGREGNQGFVASSRNTLAFSVNAGSMKTYALSFQPTAAITYSGNVNISSNATENPNRTIAVSGTGFIPPTLVLSTQALENTMLPEEIDSQIFTIGNSGSQDLSYSMTLQEVVRTDSQARASRNRNITGSTLELDTSSYNPGSTLDWTFSLYNGSTDSEWLKDLYLTFPVGVTVNSATNFVGGTGGDMTPDLTSGSGITIHWNGTDASNWGVIRNGETATATVNITIAPTTGGNLSLPYQINGDIYGAEPHVLTGQLVLEQNYTPLAWLDLDTISGTVAPGTNDPITVLYDSATLSPGIYNANIVVNSNDPINPQEIVTVELEVLSPNSAPVIDLPDYLSFGRNDQYTEDFSHYISDPDGDPLTLSYNGNTNVEVQIDGLLVTFSSINAWVGSEAITFTVDDGLLDASDTITIEFTNTAPWIDLPESISFSRNASYDLNLEPFGGDADGDGLSLVWSGNTNILVELNGLTASFSSPDGWVGSETITFTVDDGLATASDAILVTVTNTAPWVDLPESFSFARNSSLDVNLEPYGGDDDGDGLEVSWSGNTNIQVELNGLIVTFSAPNGWAGSELITFTADDGVDTASDAVLVTVTNSAPSINLPATWSFDQDTIGTQDLSVYASDPENDNLDYNYSGNTNIILDITDGVLTATPVAGWYGTEIVTITVSDGYLQASDSWEIIIDRVISDLDTPIVTINFVAGNCILDWQDVPNASYYVVYASPDPYGSYVEIGQSFDSQYQFVTNPDMAFFKVVAVYTEPSK